MPKYYGWNPNLGGGTEEQYVRNTYANTGKFINALTDFNSPYYQQFRSYLGSMIPRTSQDSIYGMAKASGAGDTNSFAISSKLKEGYDRERIDKINQGVTGFALNNVSQVGNMFGVQAGLANNQLDAWNQREVAKINNQVGWGDILSAPLGIAANFLTFGSGFGSPTTSGGGR